MKTIVLISAFLLCSFLELFGQQQTSPEVFIMGTMHEVPKIVKHSYKPLLKIAKAYNPDAIYVEYQRPNDSISLVNYESKWFLPYSDSISKAFMYDHNRINQLKKTSVRNMQKEDYKYLKDYFAVQKDKANWYYYSYLHKYGINGSKKPTRNESGDLTAKLAIAMDMNYIYPMDHQHETKSYSKNWRDCVIQSRKDGEIKYLVKQNKKSYRKAIVPAIFGRLGHYTNKQKTMKGYVSSNRFTFRKTPCEPCIEGAAIWDRRNEGIVNNIAEQVFEHDHQKAIVIVGAGHVLGIKEILQQKYPSIKVTIMNP